MTCFIALLRAVNVGKRQMAMARLRDLCGRIGYRNVRTYVASGNLIFDADATPAAIEAALGTAISAEFGFAVEPVVRRASDWPGYLAANPFPEASAIEPNRVMMMLSQRPPLADAADRIMARATPDERVAAAGGAIWIHFGRGVGPSKLSPSFIDRAIGSPATARNVRTVAKLAEMAGIA